MIAPDYAAASDVLQSASLVGRDIDRTAREVVDAAAAPLLARIKELEEEVAAHEAAREKVLATAAHFEHHGIRDKERDARIAELERHILDIDAHATPYGDIPEEPGWIGTYLVTAGALHRALGKIGHSAPLCQAEAQLQAHRAFVAAFREWNENKGFVGTPDGIHATRQRMMDALNGLAPDVHDETPEVRAIHDTP